MKIKIFTSVVIFVFTAISYPALADIDPTEIITALMKIYGVEQDNLPNLQEIERHTLDSLKEQKKQNDFLEKNLKGNYGYGKLNNDEASTRKRTWSQDNWNDVLQNTSTGNTQKFQAAQDAYAKLYPIVTKEELGKNLPANGVVRNYYDQASRISRSALAASQVSYDDINKHIRIIHDILAKLEEEKSEKAAIDLNTRLVAELSFIQLEQLKIQNMQTQLAATHMQDQVNGMSEAAKFNRIKE